MSTFKERLLEEKSQVDERGNKLDSFIKSENFATIDPVQQSLLRVQLQSMATYGQCLRERIFWLEKEEAAVQS